MLLPQDNPLVKYKDNPDKYPATHTVRCYSIWELIGLEQRFELSTRAMNIIHNLMKDNCTVGDFLDLDWDTISHQRNCGAVSLHEIRKFVDELGKSSLNGIINMIHNNREYEKEINETIDDLVEYDKDLDTYKQELTDTKKILEEFIGFSRTKGYKQLVNRVSRDGRFPLGMSKAFVFLAYQEMMRRKHA